MISEELLKENKGFLSESQIKVLKKDIFERKDYYALKTIKNKCIRYLENYNFAKKLLIELNKK